MDNNNFKNKVAKGISWSLLQQIISYISVFIFGVILARLISPEEFGLVGIVDIFLGVLPIFVDGGFANALKQKKECTNKEYSTVFYFNIFTSCFIYIILFFSAKYIADFFENSSLILITRVLGLNLILASLASIQNVILSRELNFKTIAKVMVISQVISGLIAVILAFLGLGVWALVLRTILQSLFTSTLFYWFNNWRPILVFDFDILKKLFSFGSKLLFGNIINVLFKNSFTFVIGKFYSPAQLGYYTRANNFSILPSQNITTIVQRVAFPAFSQIQEDKLKMLSVNRTMMRLLMFISLILMFGLAACSESFIISLIGAKWKPSIPYLQILCFAFVLYPAHSINVNILNALGRSDLTLKLVVIKNLLMIPVIFLGIKYGIKTMLYSMVVYNILIFFVNTIWTNKLIKYSVKKQISDILPSFIYASVMFVVTYYTFILLNDKFSVLSMLFIQIVTGFIFVVLIGELTKFSPYNDLKNTFIQYVLSPLKDKIGL